MMRINVIAGDAGGARALLPVIDRLREEANVQLKFRAYAAALNIWRAARLQVEELSEGNEVSADRVLAGTSYQPVQRELEMIQRASAEGIRTVSLLDSWSNYRPRFTSANGDLVVPDAIAVMDAFAAREMSAVGFPETILVPTGLPNFDNLGEFLGSEQTRKSRKELQEAFGLQENCGPVVLYASQPLSEMPAADTWGFHEHDVLQQVVAAVERILVKRNSPGVMLLKRHPREPEPLSERLSDIRHNLNVWDVEEDGKDYRNLIIAADLVIGMNSNLLLEACHLRRPVVSYQPNLMREDPLPSNRLGWSAAVTRPTDLDGSIERELFDEGAREQRQRVLSAIPSPGGATRRVIDLLMK